MNIQGMRLGEPCESGRLTAWPLFGADVDIGFIGEVEVEDDRSYGDTGFGTSHPLGGIAPWGMSFFFPGGQDRTLRESIFINVGETVYARMACLEPSQGGLFRGQDLTTKMLPASLIAALPATSEGGYEVLWEDIARRHASLDQAGTTVRALLESSTAVLPADLIDPRARGAMLAIDQRVIALQIAPSAAQFQTWWKEHGLSDSFAFEATTLPTLPIPLGNVGGDLYPEGDGMQEVTFLDVLFGWMYAQGGEILFASLLEKDALKTFRTHGKANEYEEKTPKTKAKVDPRAEPPGEEWGGFL